MLSILHSSWQEHISYAERKFVQFQSFESLDDVACDADENEDCVDDCGYDVNDYAGVVRVYLYFVEKLDDGLVCLDDSVDY